MFGSRLRGRGRPGPGVLRVASVLGVVVLVGLSGCSAILGGGGGAPETTQMPEPVDGYPAGVNESGLVDVEGLVSAHRSSMVRSGFVLTYEHRQVDVLPNGSRTTNVDVTGERRGEPGLAAFLETSDREMPVERTTGRWTNATAGFERTVGEETEYGRLFSNASARDTTHYTIDRMLAKGEWRVVGLAHDDQWVVLRSNETAGSGLIRNAVQGRMVVDGEGRIRKLNATIQNTEYVDELEGRINHTRRIVYEVTAVGNVTVTPPDWVEDARDATARLRAPGRVTSLPVAGRAPG